jgi:hypothetical protein
MTFMSRYESVSISKRPGTICDLSGFAKAVSDELVHVLAIDDHFTWVNGLLCESRGLRFVDIRYDIV